MQVKKLAMLLSCLMVSGVALVADGAAPKPADAKKEPAVSVPIEKPKIPAGLLESADQKPPAPAPEGCNDPSCLGLSESELRQETEIKPPPPVAAPLPIQMTPMAPPPPPPEPEIQVSDPARSAVRKSQEWQENPRAMPIEGKDGRMMFTFGDSAPTIICAPLRVCDIELEPGETVQGAPHIGDAVRWKISPAVSAEGEQKVTHLIIKPTEPGLDTNLMVPTDRRTYHLRLVSSKDKYLARVAFEYPDNTTPIWQIMMQKSGSGGSSGGGSSPSSSFSSSPAPSSPPSIASSSTDLPPLSAERINFNYKIEVISGKPRFKPMRVLDDGFRTFIAMNEDMPAEEAPVLLLVDTDGSEQLINYRQRGNIFTIDRLVDKVALISGVGRGQQRIEITRERKCAKKGWFGKCLDGSE